MYGFIFVVVVCVFDLVFMFRPIKGFEVANLIMGLLTWLFAGLALVDPEFPFLPYSVVFVAVFGVLTMLRASWGKT